MRNNASPQDRTVHTSHVDHVLVVWIEPAQRRAHAQLALWMPALATNEEGIVGLLRKLVLAGFALSQPRDSLRDFAHALFVFCRQEKWP